MNSLECAVSQSHASMGQCVSHPDIPLLVVLIGLRLTHPSLPCSTTSLPGGQQFRRPVPLGLWALQPHGIWRGRTGGPVALIALHRQHRGAGSLWSQPTHPGHGAQVAVGAERGDWGCWPPESGARLASFRSP
jgi:hypothetical protein